ncbi:MAG: hypothetical protein QOJ90_1353 [Actinomycetota bacterium]|jgi:hypothetical protein|nr:hypothetical protein [Actinomycetota bacterium]
MLGWKYNLLALLAVVAALVTGVVVGAGPLAAGANTRIQDQKGTINAEREQLRRQVRTLQGELARGSALTTAASATVARGQLPGRSVVILVLPGVTDAAVTRTARALTRAGASVVQTLRLTSTYFDPRNAKSPLEDLALRLVPPDVTFPDGASPIDRVSTVLARATVTSKKDSSKAVDQPAAEVLAGLKELGAVNPVSGDSGRRAELAVVLAPATPIGSGPVQKVAAQTAVGLASALDKAGRGVVVVGPARSATGAGVLAGLRAASTAGVSTVDVGDSAAGPLATVLAVREQLRGGSGNYGDGPGATALLPTFVAPPT